jgi:hypothetical protein
MLNPMTLDLADEDNNDFGAHCMGMPNAFHDTQMDSGI